MMSKTCNHKERIMVSNTSNKHTFQWCKDGFYVSAKTFDQDWILVKPFIQRNSF